MSLSIDNLISNYAYSYRDNLRPNLDKNSDGAWSKGEVGSFAADYKTATGNELDVDKIFDKYDSDADGLLGASEYENVYKDDALGLSSLTKSSSEGDSAVTQNKTSNLTDWMSSLSNRQKGSLTRATFMAEQTSSLIGSMFGGGGSSTANLTYAIAQYNSAKAYNSPAYWSSASASLFDRLM